MATFSVKSLGRPKVYNATTGAEEDATYLRADVLRSDGTLATLILNFADYAGLQTEWETGMATTVLDAAMDAQIAATPLVSNWDGLTAAQKTFVSTYEFSEA